MIEKSSTLYKIIILYMLEKVNFPLSNNQITNFFLDHGYTSYFHVQQTLNDLLESRLVILGFSEIFHDIFFGGV